MNIAIRTESRGTEQIVYVTGEIDVYTAPQIKERLVSLVSQPENRSVTVDLEHVQYIDSTGIGIFIGSLKVAKQTGCQLSMQQVPERLERLFRITGLRELIPIKTVEGEEEV